MALGSLLLSSAAGLTIAIAAGLYLGSSRIPWKYIIVVICVVGFFNYSKHEMRKKYWQGRVGSIRLDQMPGYFSEWTQLTLEKMFGDQITKRKEKTQGLLERVSTLQMLLYVQRKVQTNQMPPLYGETYWMIPKLMVPRFSGRKNRERMKDRSSSIHISAGRKRPRPGKPTSPGA